MNITIELNQETCQHLSQDAERLVISLESLAAVIIQNHYRVKYDDKLASQLTHDEFEIFLQQSTLLHAETLRRLAK